MEHTPTHCWCCQDPLEGRGVSLDEYTSVPCCQACWSKIPHGQRIEIAIRIMDRGSDVRGLNDLAGLLGQALRQAVDRPLDWLRGDSQN